MGWEDEGCAMTEESKPLNKPTKYDCWILEAIMRAAKQIHAEFDCLSDHVQTKRQIEEQISAIIWKHIDKARRDVSVLPTKRKKAQVLR